MKKVVLFSVLASVALFTLSCGKTETKGKEVDQPAYLVSKIKDAAPAMPEDWVEVKYASTDPAVVSELTVFQWSDEGPMGARRKALKTKASIISEKILITNIKISGSTMTADEKLIDTYDNTELLVGVYNISLNGQGYATSIKYTAKHELSEYYSEDYDVTAAYNAEGYLTKFSYERKQDKEVFEFAYEGGNVVKMTDNYSYNDGTEDHEIKWEVAFSGYDTDNIGGAVSPVMMHSEGVFEVFSSLGILGKPAPSLPSKGDWGDGDVDTYTYAKDPNGCIAMVTLNQLSHEDGEPVTYVNKYAFEYVAVK